jgi:hypothetical protein
MRQHHLLAVLLALALPLSAAAHRAPECLTTVRLNPSTENVEIVHRLHIHDAEVALASVLGEPQFSLQTLEAQARLALYVEERFDIVDAATGQAVVLTLVGAKLDGDNVLVFQETSAALPRRLSIRHDVLRDAISEQVNRVNVFSDEELRSLLFQGEDTRKELE